MVFLKDDAKDFHTSLDRALSEIEPNYLELPGLIVPGTHDFGDISARLDAIREAREKKIPTFGECGGLQVMLIEYARNVLGLVDANSTEIDPATSAPVIVKMPELRVGIFPVAGREESHRHSYRFNNAYLNLFEVDWEMIWDDTGVILEEARLKVNRFHVGTQYHPSYQSSKDLQHPLLVAFLNACRNNRK